MLQSWDQIDIPATAAGEYLCRRALRIQRAVAASPRAPSFVGLSKMIEHALDERAGLATLEFTQHFATVAEADARILKQNRVLRVELAAQGPTPLLPIADGDDDDGAVPAPSARSKKRAAKAAAKKKWAPSGGPAVATPSSRHRALSVPAPGQRLVRPPRHHAPACKGTRLAGGPSPRVFAAWRLGHFSGIVLEDVFPPCCSMMRCKRRTPCNEPGRGGRSRSP